MEKVVSEKTLLGKTVKLCVAVRPMSFSPAVRFWMSNLAKGYACYALLWEGVIGAFYSIDADLNITKLAESYAGARGIVMPCFTAWLISTFDTGVAEYARLSDAGKFDGSGFVLVEKMNLQKKERK